MSADPAAVTVLLNPKSGSMPPLDEVRAAIRCVLPGAKIAVSGEPGALEALARAERQRGVHRLIAAGGDGTLNEVLNGGLAGDAPLTLGLLPLGTGNDFARSLDLPTDLHDAVAALAASQAVPTDVVRVTGPRERLMINVSAGGFAGVVNEKLTPELKAAWGPLSYLRGMIEALGELEPYATTLEFDDGAAESLPLLNLVVANAGFVAGGIPIAPTADPADGLLDLVAIRDAPAASLALLAPPVLAGTHLEHELVLHRRAKKVRLRSSPPMTFNTDGEIFGEGEITFEVLPGALRFLRPQPQG